MLSSRAKGWRWYDWIVLAIAFIVICVLIQAVAPTSGLAHALHIGFHALSLGLQWLANGLNTLATLLNQL